jgi:dGTPase
MVWNIEHRTPEQVAQLAWRQSYGDAAPEPPAEDDPWRRDFRSPGMRDRDRILYSSAFHRLAYVTQVTAPESGITFHNRLSHSLKVAQVGRRNAERLKALIEDDQISGAAADLIRALDLNAVEAACLAHDLGHPPFGHIAEEVLQTCAAEHEVWDRFEGNAQSFRIVTRLAQRGRAPAGLDLTRRTLDGLLKYPWAHWGEDPTGKRSRKWGFYDDDAETFKWVRFDPPVEPKGEPPRHSLEAAIMEWADDLTYAVHDVDDFYRARLVPLERLGDPDSDEMKVFEQLLHEANAEKPGSLGGTVEELIEKAKELLPGPDTPTGPYQHTRDDRRQMKRFTSERITEYLSAFRVESNGGAVRVVVDDETEKAVSVLQALVRVYVIRRPGLAVVQHGQQRVVEGLFGFYYDASKKEKGDRRLFPPAYKAQLDAGVDMPSERVRLVIDLIAGLTEDSAIKLYQRLAGGAVAPTLDATAYMT